MTVNFQRRTLRSAMLLVSCANDLIYVVKVELCHGARVDPMTVAA